VAAVDAVDVEAGWDARAGCAIRAATSAATKSAAATPISALFALLALARAASIRDSMRPWKQPRLKNA